MTAVFSVLFAGIFGALAIGVWIGVALIAVSAVLMLTFRSLPMDLLFSQYIYNIMASSDLVALPMFVIMGEILFRTRLSTALFRGLAPWAALVPGRLFHINVMASSVFASISGSSAATTQVVGRISLAELNQRGYAPNIAIGSLAGAGTLGLIIPPSTLIIIYGVLAEESVLRLFTAGVIPGLLLAGTFSLWIAIHSSLQKDAIPESEEALRKLKFRQRLASLKELAPVLFLVLAVLGSMYAGIATPTEAGALGVLGATIVTLVQRTLTLETVKEVAIESTKTCSMIGLIILGATILGNVTAMMGIPEFVSHWVGDLGLSPIALIFALLILYLILGTVLEGFALIATTLPVVLPLVEAAGFDKVWFGIFLVIVTEISQITPPVAFNFVVIQGITKRSTGYLARVTMPYLLIMMAFAMLLAVFPGIVTWLPNLLYN